jgi:hypothetical protein
VLFVPCAVVWVEELGGCGVLVTVIPYQLDDPKDVAKRRE